MKWQTKARQKQTRLDMIKQDLLESTDRVGQIARDLALVRVGGELGETVVEDLVSIREHFQVSPEVLAQALIAHEAILGTDEGLDPDLGGGALELVSR